MNIPELIKKAHSNGVKHNFYKCKQCDGDGIFDTGESYELCCMCNGSTKTAKLNVYNDIKKECEEFIKSKPSEQFHKDSEQSELADIILIILAYCGETGIDIEKAVIEKMKYNETREYKHGKNY